MKCISCNVDVENLDYPGQETVHPMDALLFTTRGHYGTTFFDPMDGSYIAVVVCDECLNNKNNSDYIFRS